MNYITARDAAALWDVSERRVQKLCEDGRIPDVQRFGRSWMIPSEAQKPEDMRKQRCGKRGDNIENK